MKRLTDEQRALVEQYRPLAYYIANPVKRQWPQYDDDIESAALFALCDAAQKYDPSRGVRFITYAFVAVKRAAREAVYRGKTNGFSGTWRNGSFRAVPVVRPGDCHNDGDSRRSSFADMVPARHFFADWLYTPEPEQDFRLPPSGRKPNDTDLPPGVRYTKRGSYQARCWLGPDIGQVTIAHFTAAKCGSVDHAIRAAGAAVVAFKAYYDPAKPGHDVAGTRAYLRRRGIIPECRHVGGARLRSAA